MFNNNYTYLIAHLLLYSMFLTMGHSLRKSFCIAIFKCLLGNIILQEDCSSELQWFQEVKAQQGSVKETSFGQMDACIKLGKYRVGESGDTIFTKVNDIVTLTVETEHTRRYTLDELKDLESKLVLITGSRDYKREKVDGFLDVSINL